MGYLYSLSILYAIVNDSAINTDFLYEHKPDDTINTYFKNAESSNDFLENILDNRN